MNMLSSKYFQDLTNILEAAVFTDANQKVLESNDSAIQQIVAQAREVISQNRKLMFVGNGGSAGIASHMATDWSKNGGLRSVALNDSSMLTCLSNDFGYEHVYEKQIEYFAQEDDLLIAISSSGNSKNIINAIKAARAKKCRIFTFSGFTQDNHIRSMGQLNCYLDSQSYGFVEIGHLVILHLALDHSLGLC